MSIVVTVVVIVVVVAAVAAFLARRNSALSARTPWGRDDTSRRRRAYGREYDRLYTLHGDEAAVERELERRERDRGNLDIRELTPEEHDRLTADWTNALEQFVDDPGGAARRAEQLIGEAMAARGYRSGDAEERLALASVDHASALSEFRDGHELLQRSHSGAPGVDATEQLRQAMLRFRIFFDDLVGVPNRKEKVHA